MSTLQVTTITSTDANTPLTLQTANSGGGQIVLNAANTDIQMQGNFKFSNTAFAGNLNFTGNVGVGATITDFSSTGKNAKFAIDSGGLNLDDGYFLAWGGGTGRTSITGNKNNGTLVLASAANNSGYMTFNTNTAERMRIDSSGNLGIGTSSPQSHLHLEATNPVFRIRDLSASGGIAFMGTDVTGLYFRTFTADTTRFLRASGAESMRITSDGRVGIGTTSPTYPLVISKNGYQGLEVSVDGTADAPVLISYNRANGAYSRASVAAANIHFLTGTASASERMVIGSTGVQSIQFAATQVASADSNTLDDYEEGTWTPTYAGTTSGTGTHTQQTGYYVKVGRLVTVWFIIRGTRGTTSGNLVITGLPFPVFNSGMDYGYMVKTGGYWGGWVTVPNTMYATNGQSYIALWDVNTNAINSSTLDASVQNNMMGQLCYLSTS